MVALFNVESFESRKYKFELNSYVNVIEPFARAIECLGATNAMAADVFLFWHAIFATLRELLLEPQDKTGITPTLSRKIVTTVNKHYRAFINNGPTDIYFAAFFLDARKSLIHKYIFH